MLRRVLVLVCALAMAIVPMVLAAAPARASNAASGCEASWANGQLYCMIGPHVNFNPNPNLLATAQDLYLAAYMPLPSSCDTSHPATCLPESLPSGYMPNCNPCFHGGPLNAFPYHDHVLEGSPGMGTNGTATTFMGPWVIIIVVYNPGVSNSPSFVPYKSAAGIDSGEQAGAFLPINQGPGNPYEINTGVVLICPLVGPMN